MPVNKRLFRNVPERNAIPSSSHDGHPRADEAGGASGWSGDRTRTAGVGKCGPLRSHLVDDLAFRNGRLDVKVG